MIKNKLMYFVLCGGLLCSAGAYAGGAIDLCPGQSDLQHVLTTYFDNAKGDAEYWSGNDKELEDLLYNERNWQVTINLAYPALTDSSEIRKAVLDKVDRIKATEEPHFTNDKSICAYEYYFDGAHLENSIKMLMSSSLTQNEESADDDVGVIDIDEKPNADLDEDEQDLEQNIIDEENDTSSEGEGDQA